jgi:hypothetical protein
MQKLDLQIPVGGTFRIRGRIRNALDNTYWDFSDATLALYVDDDKGEDVDLLTASTGAGTITLEENGTVFNVYVAQDNTATITFKYGTYTLWVTWPNGDLVPLVGGRLNPFKPVLPA